MHDPRARTPFVLDTIGKLIDDDYKLIAHCHAVNGQTPCGNRRRIDLEALAVQIGRDHSCMAADLVPKLKCSRCGSKDVSIRLLPPTGVPNLN